MDQRKTVLLADAGEEFRTLLWEEMEKTGEFSVEIARDGNERNFLFPWINTSKDH